MSSIIDLTTDTIKRVMKLEASISYNLLANKQTLSKDQMAEVIYEQMCKEEKRTYRNDERKALMG